MNKFFSKAKWIAPNGVEDLPVLQKQFYIDTDIKTADIYISGLGLYELHINGKKAHDTYFEPGESVYNKIVFYNVFDVKKYLHKGENKITVHLGNGFYHNAQNTSERLNREPKILGDYMLLCQVNIKDINNDNITICSDESWKCSRSKITESIWLGGEECDERIEYDFSNSVSVVNNITFKLKQRPFSPIKAIKEIKPISSKKLANGNTLIDFGLNFAGTYIFKGKAERNTKINFYFGEILNNNGSVNQKDFWGKIYDTYIFANENAIEFSPKFVYHGFRYIEVEGYNADELNFTGIMLHCDNKKISVINTDNRQITSIHKLICRSIEDNMQSVITDCPHREKLGWTEVYQLLFSTISYNYDTESYYKKLIYDLIDAQKENGSIPSIVPPFTTGIKTHALRNGTDDTPNDPSWCGAIIFAAYEYYLFYGNKDFLQTVYPYMKKYLKYISALSVNHLLPAENLNRNLGDWMSTDPPSVSYVVSCVYYRLYDTMAKIADILNTGEDFITEKNNIKSAIHAEYFNSSYYDNGSQSADTLAIAYGIANDSDKQKIMNHLITNIKEKDYHLTVGEVALKPLFDVLCEYGYGNIAYKVWLNAYGGFADTHTTLPESWSGKYSQNHAMLGAGDSFFFEHIAGIQNAGVGFNKIKLAPIFPNDMNCFSVNLKTKNGNISVDWKRIDDKIVLNCLHDKKIKVDYIQEQDNIIFKDNTI
jgi:alpha-L-rhamnosidase